MPHRKNSGAGKAEPAEAVALPLRVGESLKVARERMGVSIAQAAERLRVDAAVIAALEEERFDSLGAPVYVRGHLRRYAAFLGEPEGPLQDGYARSEESQAPPDLTQAPRVPTRSPAVLVPWFGLLCGGLLVLGVLLWWGLHARPAP